MADRLPPISARFARYHQFSPAVPVWQVTSDRPIIHRFFDTSPFSPSGRFLGLTELPSERRLPEPGDTAHVVVVDLTTGESQRVASTRAWDTQLGGQVQWGADDHALLYNDMELGTWRPFAVQLDPATGARRQLDGTVYMASADGRWLASPSLDRMGLAQPGYGVHVPDAQRRPRAAVPDDDGIWVTNTASGSCKLLASIRRLVEEAHPAFERDRYADGEFVAFHVKWNPQGSRLMVVLRFKSHRDGSLLHDLVTLSAAGDDVRVALPARVWLRGGHHPNWYPDGEHILINLRLEADAHDADSRGADQAANKGMLFARMRYDGTGLQAVAPALPGSGHPTLHADQRHIVTDAYLHETLAFGDGTVPLRWVDTETATETTLARVPCEPAFAGPRRELRIDPHPAWDRSFRRIAFNARTAGNNGPSPDAPRGVFVADLSSLLD